MDLIRFILIPIWKIARFYISNCSLATFIEMLNLNPSWRNQKQLWWIRRSPHEYFRENWQLAEMIYFRYRPLAWAHIDAILNGFVRICPFAFSSSWAQRVFQNFTNVLNLYWQISGKNFWARFTGKLIHQKIMSIYSVFLKKLGRELDRYTGKPIQSSGKSEEFWGVTQAVLLENSSRLYKWLSFPVEISKKNWMSFPMELEGFSNGWVFQLKFR